MKKRVVFKILISILLANIVVFMLPFFLMQSGNSPINSTDPLQIKLQTSSIMVLVLNISILMTFLIYRKIEKKPKPLKIFLLALGIFVVELFLLFRNMMQFSQTLSQNIFGLSSFAISFLLFGLFNLSVAYVITHYKKRKIDRK